MTQPKRIIIDTDPGIDDAAAILMALGSPELQVEAFTTVFGNTPVERCTVNALRIAEAANRADIPVFEGIGRPFDFSEPSFAAYIHGEDGLGDVGLPQPSTKPQTRSAVFELVDRIMASPGEITLVAIGRLTNVALAISIEPGIAKAVQEIVVMGGAVTVPGNASPVASANLWGDPQAADIVYRSGARIVQVGLDVCNQVEISPKHQDKAWSSGTPAGELLKKITPFIKAAYNRRGRLDDPDGVRYNDVPAMAYVIDPTLFECRDYYVRIETQGSISRGQTVAYPEDRASEPPNTTVALGVDAPRLVDLWADCVGSI